MNPPREPIPTVDEVTQVGQAAQLTVMVGSARGRRFKVEESATIGRSPDATIMLEDPEVSRLHARVSRIGRGAFRLEDLNSRNGTTVNGTRTSSRLLAYGDKIGVGPHTVLEFQRFDATEDSIIQRQRFEAIGRLGVGIAHDLKNILAALDADASFLQALPADRSLGDADVRACIADLTLAAVRGTELTRGVLSFARGRGTDQGCVDLGSLVSEVVRMLHHVVEHSIRIESAVEPDIYVHGSKSELHQVLLNLCLNARDAMPRGGILRITAGGLTTAPSELGWEPARPAAFLTVADTGGGMDAETQARVFEPFFTTKREGAGYGLGLATVREIVAMHGGQIDLESAPDQGTRFKLFFPRLDPHSLRLSSTAERTGPVQLQPESGAVSILLVDDEQILRRSIARRLRQAGFVVTEAADGAEAVARYRERPHHLVLLDLDMPVLDGEQAQARLLALDPNVAIVFATGYADPSREAAVRARGALALLEKPYSIEQVVSLVNQVLAEQSNLDSLPPTGPL